MKHTDQAPEIIYVVGAGAYPYRADGLRMSGSEAASYLVEIHSMSALAAQRLLDMITAKAVRDAGQPRVEYVDGEGFRVDGSEPLFRGVALGVLTSEWRRTRGEASRLLAEAMRPTV